ncbi:hypothetical protein C8D97_10735 [Pleionea mediterranea]|uniref:Uncharacterized protein n=1 Tax=Pleionea mediterranea TaxID=523701 RepID=A0A316FMC5_9GAMM|nr:hypothetical protein C8D97_10735 [Pleionea mediterranea]
MDALYHLSTYRSNELAMSTDESTFTVFYITNDHFIFCVLTFNEFDYVRVNR